MSLKDLSIGIALMCLWGFNFSVIKLGVNTMNPFLLAAMRFFFAVVPLILFIRKPNVPWRYMIAYGLSFGVGVWGIITCAIETGLPSGTVSLLMQLSVITSLAIGYFYFKERIRNESLMGAALALLGLSLIIYAEFTKPNAHINTKGIGLALTGAFFWSINGTIVKLSKTKEVFAFNVWSMMFAPFALVALAYVTQAGNLLTHAIEQLNMNTWFSILFQAYPTTLLGYWVWNRLLVKYTLSEIEPLTLLVTVFAFLGGYIFYQQTISNTQILATIFILSGILVRQRFFQRWYTP